MRAKKKMSALLVALLFSTAAWGGLGGIAVRSNLGEVLRADIDLTGNGEEEYVRVGLAPMDTFRDLQVDYSPALTSLRFALAYRSNGKPYIRVLSVQPVSEPYLRFVVEARTASGRSIREYTVLLDPVEYPNKADAIERSAKATAAAEPARLKPATPAAVRTPLPAPAEAPAPDTIVVKRGQTLAHVGRIVRADGASLRQTMAALVLANPGAFQNGDPTTLRAGTRLKVPSAAAAKGLKPARVAEVLDGAAPAARAPARVAAAAAVPRQAPAVAPAQPVLKLEQPDAAANLAAQDAQLKAAQQKIAELEEKLKSLQTATPAPAPAAASAAATAHAVAPAAASQPAAEQPASAPAHKAPEVMASAPVHKPLVVASEPVEEGPSLLDQLMSYLPLIAGGLSAVLLGVAAIVFLRRRKRGGKAATEVGGASILGAGTVGRVAAVDEAAGNTFLADFTRTGMNGMDSGEVDPVAEAEVYLAYGRDQQAEEILKDALAKDPTRHEVRMKLLEIYASRQDKAAFEGQAREMHAAFDGKGTLWSRTATLGLSIDPNNPLYAGNGETAAPVVAVASAAAVSIDLDSELMGDAAELEALPQQAFIEPEAVAADDDPLRAALFGEDEPAAKPAEATLDLDSLLAEPETVAEPVPEPEPEDKHMLDFDFNLDTLAPAAAAPVEAEAAVSEGFDFDLSSLDEPAPAAAPAEAAPSLDGMSLSDDPLSTKLDLARVYLDMGDKEGAREVLEELLAEAQGALKSEAESLLASL